MKRRWLLLGAASAAVLAVGGGTLALMHPGLVDARLSPGGREVFTGAARGVLDGTLSADAAKRSVEIDKLLTRIDALVANLPPHAQAELSQLLALLASAPGRLAFAGLSTPWDEASVADVQKALQAMRVSSVSLKRQAYQALHDIVGGAWFADESTWAQLGYPGPKPV